MTLIVVLVAGCEEEIPRTLAGPEPTPPAAPSPPAAPEPPSVPDQPPLPGSLEVTIETIGDDFDPDGYSLVIDDGSGVTTSLDEQITLTDLAAGFHRIELLDVATNCRVTNVQNPSVAEVPDGGTAEVLLVVFCLPPDSGRIFYKKESNSTLFSMSPIGADPIPIGPVIDQFSVSRDGEHIVFTQSTAEGFRLYTQNADGSDVTLLVTDGVEPGSRPDLSPDGTRIAFAERGGDGDIFVINADGSGLINLTVGELDPGNPKADPAWSPDGSRIVFTSLQFENGPLYVVNPDGTGLRQLTHPLSGFDHVRAGWSPDGQGLLLVETSFDDFFGTEGHLSFVRADGTAFHRVFSAPPSVEAISWSPDGRWIAFSSGGLHMIRADGTDLVRVTSGRVSSPRWR